MVSEYNSRPWPGFKISLFFLVLFDYVVLGRIWLVLLSVWWYKNFFLRIMRIGCGESGISASRDHLVFAYYVTGHGLGHATRVVEVHWVCLIFSFFSFIASLLREKLVKIWFCPWSRGINAPVVLMWKKADNFVDLFCYAVNWRTMIACFYSLNRCHIYFYYYLKKKNRFCT